ncbi:MAG: CBS domain-containing protein, partial [Phototrophicaceae bacterium]
MPITAGDLIEGRTPVWTTLDAPILMALMVMQKHDFSQLPIVDDRGRQLGIVTAERILRTQRRYGAPLDTLLVDNAATKAVVVAPDDRLSDVFDLFGKHPAVLVVDSEQVLMGIITPWDAAFHLQQRAEDMMLIEDIEKSLKEHIRASYSDAETGKLDTVALESAIADITDPTVRNTRRLHAALQRFLKTEGITASYQAESVTDAFCEFIGTPSTSKGFDDLTLNQYIDLLLAEDRWATYRQTFKLEAAHLRKLLNDVRVIRNKFAHFRDEIDNDERDTLRFCLQLFDRHPAPAFQPTGVSDTRNQEGQAEDEAVPPVQDELGPGESRYARLALFLQEQPRKIDRITLPFEEVERVLQGPLPSSALEHRSWWANDSVSHVQSQQWLDAGWQVATVSLSDQRVTFARSAEREQMYIRFFSPIVNTLRERDAFPLRNVRLGGNSWADLTWLPYNASRRPGALVWAFSRRSRFRVELY